MAVYIIATRPTPFALVYVFVATNGARPFVNDHIPSDCKEDLQLIDNIAKLCIRSVAQYVVDNRRLYNLSLTMSE